ncbi:acetyltransferase (GNAT) family protein [Pseudomonas duriflava]|uniref:Acetyltransferase (GNAT) family protein n=2 Tax=Pseudomonas duriflava TaxID=459528 RepID=A0A562PTL9_9PSED|nr:acetyltransferase (GNAT) family protein [Pseudomonas duriflava]
MIAATNHAVWRSLWQRYLAFYQTTLPDDILSLTWQRLLDPAEPMQAALAWQDGHAVGLVHWIYHRSCWTAGHYCYLQDLFVQEEVRGQGVGRELISYVQAAARAKACSRVYWLTHESNHDAQRLYDQVAERSGFIQFRQSLL